MSQFSSALLLADLDYIAPSQVCIIKPVTSVAESVTDTGRDGDSGVSDRVFRHDKGEVPPPPTKMDMVKISLQDCLACSGCVTTAETMLVLSQSRPEIEAIYLPSLATNGNTKEEYAAQEIDDIGIASHSSNAVPTASKSPLVVSISEQSAASIAVQLSNRRRRLGDVVCNISIKEAKNYISGFFKKHLGAKLVIDTEWAQIISTRETAKEYKRRLLLPSGMEKGRKVLPMIIASCPGWVCYCEKTHPQLLPLLCPVMSPQGITGSFVKHVFPECYHVSIQPCFDRKLESVREDFLIPNNDDELAKDDSSVSPTTKDSTSAAPNERMINCVLSTGELWEWMLDVEGACDGRLLAPLDSIAKIFDVRNGNHNNDSTDDKVTKRNCDDSEEAKCLPLSSSPLSQKKSGILCDAELLTGSGAYHQYCVTTALSDLCFPSNSSSPAPCLPWSDFIYQTKRNSNYRVISVKDCVDKSKYIQDCIKASDAPESLSSARPISLPVEALGEVCVSYGFQHIQNIVRSINRKMTSVAKYTLIEMMACPEGCLNGGGQVRGTGVGGGDTGHVLSNAETLAAVQAVYLAGREISNIEQRNTNKLRSENEGKSCEGSESAFLRGVDDNPSFLATSWATSYLTFDESTCGGHQNSLRSAMLEPALSAVRMTFHDRKADMDKMENVVASLKW